MARLDRESPTALSCPCPCPDAGCVQGCGLAIPRPDGDEVLALKVQGNGLALLNVCLWKFGQFPDSPLPARQVVDSAMRRADPCAVESGFMHYGPLLSRCRLCGSLSGSDSPTCLSDGPWALHQAF